MVGGSIHSEALEELAQAVAFYEDRAAGLGREFLDEVERVLGLIRRNPLIGAEVLRPYRRILVPRFPFSIIYRQKPAEVRVLAFMHHRRRPGYWRGRS